MHAASAAQYLDTKELPNFQALSRIGK